MDRVGGLGEPSVHFRPAHEVSTARVSGWIKPLNCVGRVFGPPLTRVGTDLMSIKEFHDSSKILRPSGSVRG